jgi:hypothetical protein
MDAKSRHGHKLEKLHPTKDCCQTTIEGAKRELSDSRTPTKKKKQKLNKPKASRHCSKCRDASHTRRECQQPEPLSKAQTKRKELAVSFLEDIE